MGTCGIDQYMCWGSLLDILFKRWVGPDMANVDMGDVPITLQLPCPVAALWSLHIEPRTPSSWDCLGPCTHHFRCRHAYFMSHGRYRPPAIAALDHLTRFHADTFSVHENRFSFSFKKPGPAEELINWGLENHKTTLKIEASVAAGNW